MRKVSLLIAAATLSLLPVSFTVKDAQARLGRPLTPFSVAGVHRRVMRRNFGVGWRGWHHPVAVAAVGAGLYGASQWGGYGYGGGSCSCPPVYGYGASYGGGWGAPGVGGWGSGLGWGFGAGWGAPGFGWRRGWF